MRLLLEIAIFQTVKSKVIISLFETVRLSVSISLRNLYNSLNSIKETEVLEGWEVKLGPRHSMTGNLCQPSNKWIPFSHQGRIRQRKERDKLGF